jgi:methylated-DNA-[protein]-cysteine S-methyltransferase
MKFDDPKFTKISHRNVWGEWTFVFEGSKLCGLKFQGSSNEAKAVRASSVQACAYASPDIETELKGYVRNAYRKAVNELNLYLAGKICEFSIPIKIYGTEFQKKVLEFTRNIPYGKTVTYKQVAKSIGEPQATRAVGNALHNNPLQVIIPCHRVIDSRGHLSGYTLGVGIKRRLLCMEGALPNELIFDS